MRTLSIAVTLLLAACQPAPFETTPHKEDDSSDGEQDGRPERDQNDDKNVSMRKVGAHGPFASLEAVCGGETPRCRPAEPVAVKGGGEVLAVATFQDGAFETGLAIQTAKGWYIDHEPGQGPMWSHHSPHSTFFDLERMSVKPDGVSLLVTRGMSSFIGGMGNRGSSRNLQIARRTCRVRDGAVVCEETAPLYERSCQTPMEEGGAEVCSETGKKP
ncbi:MAG: hypothetical protein JNL21_32930 [Myxococcales bacterium]|nr:hypothetical protein [Myxococcales bacterium]